MRLFVFILLFIPAIISARVVSVEKVAHYDREALKRVYKKIGLSRILTPIRYEVDVYEVDYVSSWLDGQEVVVSGVFFLPVNCKEDPAVMLYNHGTSAKRGRKLGYHGEENICLFYATDGYAVLAPDNVGLGRSDSIQLYMVAESEASDGVNFLLAFREWARNNNYTYSDQLFITGYSQGGHSTVAQARKLQTEHPEIGFTAASPMSGPYDISGVQVDYTFKGHSPPMFFLMLMSSYNKAYSLWSEEEFSFLLKSPFDTLTPYFLRGDFHLKNRPHIPPSPYAVVKDSVIDAFYADSTHPYRLALQENNLTHWIPESPMQLCFCNGDKAVNPENAKVFYQFTRRKGSKIVTLKRVSKKFGHEQCAGYAALYTKFYFDTFRKGKKRRNGPCLPRFIISVNKFFTKARTYQL